MDQDYDLVVIGSGPAGQKAAINASKLGKRVAVIERAGMVGGVSVHSGTIPSKTVRDAVLYLTGFNERAFYGQDYRLREQINRDEIASRVRTIVTRETHLIRSQFSRNRVGQIDGTGRLPELSNLPREIIVIGGGIIGLEYASMFPALEIRVTVIEQHPQILEFVDKEIVEALSYHLRELEVVFRLGEKVVTVELDENRN